MSRDKKRAVVADKRVRTIGSNEDGIGSGGALQLRPVSRSCNSDWLVTVGNLQLNVGLMIYLKELRLDLYSR